jgi:hypothetical protein
VALEEGRALLTLELESIQVASIVVVVVAGVVFAAAVAARRAPPLMQGIEYLQEPMGC